ncbi:MAG: hypothetical protein ACYDBH_12240 [Acidobacteriaceae bacterium]
MDPIKMLGALLGPDAVALFGELKTELPKWLADFDEMKRRLERIEAMLAAQAPPNNAALQNGHYLENKPHE